jgi:hypothetical protein
MSNIQGLKIFANGPAIKRASRFTGPVAPLQRGPIRHLAAEEPACHGGVPPTAKNVTTASAVAFFGQGSICVIGSGD